LEGRNIKLNLFSFSLGWGGGKLTWPRPTHFSEEEEVSKQRELKKERREGVLVKLTGGEHMEY